MKMHFDQAKLINKSLTESGQIFDFSFLLKFIIMKQILLYLISGLILMGCGPAISYVGSSSQPTEKVDVFVNESAIKRPFDIIGKGYPDIRFTWPAANLPEKLMNQAVKKARKMGADAVFFYDYFLLQDGKFINTSTVAKTDTATQTTTVNNSISVLNNAITERQEIFFLKYK